MVQFLLDQFGDGDVSARAMFGGHGIYRGGRMFAIVYKDTVYMKVSEADAQSSARPPLNPRRNQTLWSYRAVSADELEDREELAALAEKAQHAASS